MNKDERIALMALPIVLLTGLGFAFAGGSNSGPVSTVPLYGILVTIAFLIQWVVFIPSYFLRTEKFYDLTGGVTYITVAIVAVVISETVDMRSVLLLGMIIVWAARLAGFLFLRIRKDGKDGRFDDIKTSFLRFLLAWTLQGLWVTFTLAAALTAITTPLRKELGWFAIAGGVIWLVGFSLEAIADAQKRQFKQDSENKGKFIQTGLWSKSRHPNYFGEIVLWIGVAVIAFPVMQGWQYLTLLSPVFVALLLIKISGIPMLEKRADDKWGGQPDYEAYKENTPVLIPKL